MRDIYTVDPVSSKNLKGILRNHVLRDARIITDKCTVYNGLDREHASHESVDHGIGEYVNGDIHTCYYDLITCFSTRVCYPDNSDSLYAGTN